MLEDEGGSSQAVSGEDLGTILHDHHSLRLVVLNSCEGARSSAANPFAGVAQGLVRQGIPAVVAMQFEISDDAAIEFSSSLYEALADGYPIDAAVGEARKAMFAARADTEWGTPVLFLRSPDGSLFDYGDDKSGRRRSLIALAASLVLTVALLVVNAIGSSGNGVSNESETEARLIAQLGSMALVPTVAFGDVCLTGAKFSGTAGPVTTDDLGIVRVPLEVVVPPDSGGPVDFYGISTAVDGTGRPLSFTDDAFEIAVSPGDRVGAAIELSQGAVGSVALAVNTDCQDYMPVGLLELP